MEVSTKILTYLSISGKENKYRLASALKINAWEVTKALRALEEEGKIEIKDGKAILVREKNPIKTVKRQPEIEEDVPEEEPEAGLEKAQPEETTVEEEAKEEEITKEEVQETEATPEEEEEWILGTVKFFNPKRGFGFITGDAGEKYYVHKSALKEGVTIEVNDRVSFRVVQGNRGPQAEEIEWISQA